MRFSKVLAFTLAIIMVLGMVPAMALLSSAEDTRTNYAAGKSVTTGAGVSGSAVTDGVTSGTGVDISWSVNNAPNPQCYVIVDLGEVVEICEINVVNYIDTSRYYLWDAYVSVDGTEYTKIGAKTANAPSDADGFSIFFDPTEVRYIKIVGTYGSANVGYHFVEVRAFDEVPATVASGTIEGSSINWAVDTENRLTFTGTGAIPDFKYENKDGEITDTRPYAAYRDTITSVVVGSGITKIGRQAATHLTKLSYIVIGKDVTEIMGDCFAYSGASALVFEGVVKTVHSGIVFGTTIKGVELKQMSVGELLLLKEQAVYNDNLINAIPTTTTEIEYKIIDGTTLYISAPEGKFLNLDGNSKPWSAYNDSITKIIVADNVNYVKGLGSMDNVEEIVLGIAAREFGSDAFAHLPKLKKITFLGKVTSIGQGIVYDTKNIEEVYVTELTFNDFKTLATKSAYNFKETGGIGTGFDTATWYDKTAASKVKASWVDTKTGEVVYTQYVCAGVNVPTYCGKDIPAYTVGNATYTPVMPETSTITADTVYEITYEAQGNVHAVTWLYGDNSTKVDYVADGVTPSFVGDTAKKSTWDAVYTFTGWDKEVVACTEDVTYTAQYSAAPRPTNVLAGDPYGDGFEKSGSNMTLMYMLTATDVNGQETFYKDIYNNASNFRWVLTVDGREYRITPTSCYDFSSSKITRFPVSAGDDCFLPEANLAYYGIKLDVYSDNNIYGETIHLMTTGDNSTKTWTWLGQDASCFGTYHTVTWQINGETVHVSNVREGVTPTYPGEPLAPTKVIEEVENVLITNPAVLPCTADATYNMYYKVPGTSIVTWKYEDGTIDYQTTVDDGEVPEYKGSAESYSDGYMFYEVNIPGIGVAVGADTEYTITFTAKDTRKVSIGKYSNGIENWSGNTQFLVILSVDGKDFDIQSSKNDYDWMITINDKTFNMTPSSTSGLWGSGILYRFTPCVGEVFIPSCVEGTEYVVSLELYEKGTDTLAYYSDGTVTLTVPANFVPVHNHNYDETTNTPATCTVNGVKDLVCKDCGYATTGEIVALGHSFVNNVCTVCGTAETADVVADEKALDNDEFYEIEVVNEKGETVKSLVDENGNPVLTGSVDTLLIPASVVSLKGALDELDVNALIIKNTKIDLATYTEIIGKGTNEDRIIVYCHNTEAEDDTFDQLKNYIDTAEENSTIILRNLLGTVVDNIDSNVVVGGAVINAKDLNYKKLTIKMTFDDGVNTPRVFTEDFTSVATTISGFATTDIETAMAQRDLKFVDEAEYLCALQINGIPEGEYDITVSVSGEVYDYATESYVTVIGTDSVYEGFTVNAEPTPGPV